MNTRILAILTCLLAVGCAKTPNSDSNAGTSSGATAANAPTEQQAPKSPLLDPTAATWKTKAPAEYKAKFETTAGDFVIQVHRDWAPHGADRFYNLVRNGFYDHCRFFRVAEGFVVQWGISGDPKVAWAWQNETIPDDPVKHSNKPGTIVFATAGPNTRTTQLFINLGDNSGSLDSRGFAPFGEVVEGMKAVHDIDSEYGETPSQFQSEITSQGNAFLSKHYPHLTEIKRAYIEK